MLDTGQDKEEKRGGRVNRSRKKQRRSRVWRRAISSVSGVIGRG